VAKPAIFCQKAAKSGRKNGFCATGSIKAVKVRGSCQSGIGTHFFQDRREQHVGVQLLRMSRLPKRCCDALRKGGASGSPESAPQHLREFILQGIGVAGLKPRPFGVLIYVLQEVLDRVDTASLLDFCGRSPPWTRGPRRTWRGQSIDSTMVVRHAARPREPLHAEFKGLTNHVSGERRTTISSLVGRPKRGEGHLLIPQWLLAGRLTEESGRSQCSI